MLRSALTVLLFHMISLRRDKVGAGYWVLVFGGAGAGSDLCVGECADCATVSHGLARSFSMARNVPLQPPSHSYPIWFVSGLLLLRLYPLLLLSLSLLLRPREKALNRDPGHKGAAANLARIRESQQQGGAGGVMEAVERGARAIHRAVAATAATAATAAARGNLASA